jgi:hypothetical protein
MKNRCKSSETIQLNNTRLRVFFIVFSFPKILNYIGVMRFVPNQKGTAARGALKL